MPVPLGVLSEMKHHRRRPPCRLGKPWSARYGNEWWQTSTQVGLVQRNPCEGRLATTGVAKATLAERVFEEQGVDMARVRFKGGGRAILEKMRNKLPTCWAHGAKSRGCW